VITNNFYKSFWQHSEDFFKSVEQMIQVVGAFHKRELDMHQEIMELYHLSKGRFERLWTVIESESQKVIPEIQF
jgi:hypothetical protein